MQRTRSRPKGLDSTSVDLIEFDFLPGCSKTTKTVKELSVELTGGIEIMEDIVVPDFHRRIEAGEIINNPCSYTATGVYESDSIELKIDQQYGNCGWAMKEWREYAGQIPLYAGRNVTAAPIPAPTSRSVEASIQAAKSKAIAEIDSTPYGFGEDVLEIRETLRFLRAPAASLKNLARDIWRKRQKAVPFGAQAVADVYLAHRFAVTPLMLSIQDGTEAIKKTIESAERPQRRTARGFDMTLFEDEGDPGEKLFENFSYINWQGFRRRSHIVRAGILYEVSNPVVNYPFYLGLRAKDLPEAVWAVVPWSFIIDRAFNVSNLIRGLTNLSDPSVTILAAWVVEKRDDVHGRKALSARHRYAGTAIRSFTPGEWRRNTFSYTRTPWSPTYIDTIPPLNLKGLVDDAIKVADDLALAAQFLSRK